MKTVRPYLEQVLKSSHRASDLVKQVLSISRQTEQKPILMQLGPIVKECLKLLRASFPCHHRDSTGYRRRKMTGLWRTPPKYTRW